MKAVGFAYFIMMTVALCALNSEVAQATDDTDTFYGAYAGNSNTTGVNNSFFGFSAGYSNTTGNNNTCVGFQTAYNYNNIGSNNTFVGSSAGGGGSDNTYVGYKAGLGYSLSNDPISGTYNTYIGDSAGFYSTIGQNNTAVGGMAGYKISSGNNNTLIGNNAGYYLSSGHYNTFLGFNAGRDNIAGTGNVFIGSYAGSSETGSNKLYIDNCYYKDSSVKCTIPLISGDFVDQTVTINGSLTAGTITSNSSFTAGSITTTGTLSAGTVTTTSGGIQFPDGSSQTKGLAGLSNSNNSFFGNNAGRITTGVDNTFVGNNTGYSNSGGYSNSFFGYNAGYSNTLGYSNSFVGFSAGYSNNAGYSNSFFGNGAGNNNTSGHNNTFIGVTTGFQNTLGSGNVFLGYYAGYSETGSNKLYIDNCFTGGNCNLPLIKGDFSGRTVEINGTLTMTNVVSPSDRRLKRNIEPLNSSLDKVMHLQGVSYEWKVEENPGRGFTSYREIGLIAQDVEGVIPELVRTDSEGYKALAYDKMVPVLIEAIKEQEGIISNLQKGNTEKDARIEKLEKALELVERRLAVIESPSKTVALK
jgi:hypothetical protein